MYLRDVGTMDTLPLLSRSLQEEEDPETQRQLQLAMAAVKVRSNQEERKRISDPLPHDTPLELLTR